MSRPSTYSEEIAATICEQLADGKSLRSICEQEEMPAKSTVFKWLADHEAFSDQYARAREAQANVLVDQIIDIADDGYNDSYKDEDGNTRVNQDVIARRAFPPALFHRGRGRQGGRQPRGVCLRPAGRCGGSGE